MFIECNHFGGIPADIDTFERGGLFRDDEVLAQQAGTLGGAVKTLSAFGANTIGLVAASACASGPVIDSCYHDLKEQIIARLKASLPVDGVLLVLHGAAVSESCLDVDGDLLIAVRDAVGPDVPVVATLDLHAHVTEAMVESADALLAWETYPHADAYETGERAARLLAKIVEGDCRPVMVMAKVPLLCSAIHGSTHGDDPFAVVMRFAKSFEQEPDVLSASAFLVHPYLDLPGMGGGGLVITDGNAERAEQHARDIAELYWSKRNELEPKIWAPAAAIRHGRTLNAGPVFLVEAGDCCGGGAAGDSIATLAALLDENTSDVAYVPVVDPEAAAACHAAGVGQQVNIALGHKLDKKWGEPLNVTGDVARLGDGRFLYTGGIWNEKFGDMGLTAVLKIGAVHVMISSFPTYDWADEQYQSMGLDIEHARFVVFKNPMNHRLLLGDVAAGILVLDTPGPTPATLCGREFTRMQRPYFPRDLDIPGLEPTLLRSRSASDRQSGDHHSSQQRPERVHK